MKMWLQQSDALGAADQKQIFDLSKTFYRQSESEQQGCNSRRFYLVGLEYLWLLYVLYVRPQVVFETGNFHTYNAGPG